jgi:hypothetical protein
LIGYGAGYDNTTGVSNVILGNQAGWSNTSGANNVYLGTRTAYTNTTGTGNVFIGYQAGWSEAGSDRLYIENSNAAAPLIYGQFNLDRVGINDNAPTANLHIKQVGSGEEGLAIENDDNSNRWSFEVLFTWLSLQYNGAQVGYWNDVDGSYNTTSDKRLKKDIEYMDKDILDRVMKLKPTTYRLLHADPSDHKTTGFIAQEVKEVFPELVYQETEDSYLSLHYPDFGVIAIKAIQEQQEEIEDLKKQIQELKALLNK